MHERIVEVCSAGNMVEADGLCELLEEAGIQARVVGDDLGIAAGGLPLGESIAPRIWVHESDAARAREVIDQWRDRTDERADRFGRRATDLPEWESPVEPEEAALPSDVRFRFLSQGFFLAGLVCVLVGAIWAWKNSLTLSKYSATTEGRLAGMSPATSRVVSVPRDPNLPLQPIVKKPISFEFVAKVRYAYVVAGKTYDAYRDYDDVGTGSRPGANPLRSASSGGAHRRVDRAALGGSALCLRDCGVLVLRGIPVSLRGPRPADRN